MLFLRKKGAGTMENVQNLYCPLPGTKLGSRESEEHTVPVSMEVSE